ncbi:glycosyltransferase family 61 protein [Acidisphaera rubrifaciens]|uniref:glycosyltransferase family 61 protein n=1 Tax=Acidisphaera rubrifaciens TaxID=50715 RepID=UPI001F52506D|nr:glycosyltransferase family 61 protein [Acidisphaera rubrifaciens]
MSYLTLMTERAPQRDHSLRELFNALRYVSRYGIALACCAERLPALGCGVSAIPTLAGGGMFGDTGEGLGGIAAPGLRPVSGRSEEPTGAIIGKAAQHNPLGWSGLLKPIMSGWNSPSYATAVQFLSAQPYSQGPPNLRYGLSIRQRDMTFAPDSLAATDAAVQTYLIERTAKSTILENAPFEALFSAPNRNPHLGWNPDPQSIRGYQFLNAMLDGKFRGLFLSERFIRDTGYLVSDEAMSELQAEYSGTISCDVAETVVVGCNIAHNNYFHWITQALPAIYHASKRAGRTQDIRIALPPLNKWQEDSLRLLGLDNMKRFTIEYSTKRYAFARMEYSEFLNGGASFAKSDVARETYLRLRTAVNVPGQRNKKLYVARTDAPTRVMRNERDLIERLRHRGYEILTPGSLSLAGQIELFRSARIVVGPHGAGLTNIVFCEPGTVVYELVPSHYTNGCFCNLAYLSGLRYWQDAFDSAGSGLPNFREWESETPFVLSRLREIEEICASLPSPYGYNPGRQIAATDMEHRAGGGDPVSRGEAMQSIEFSIYEIKLGERKMYGVYQPGSGIGRQYSVGGFVDEGAAIGWIKRMFPGASILKEFL